MIEFYVFQCPKCGKRFAKEKRLMIHSKTHEKKQR
ncbi:MAG TPA: hypothetical protein EYP96_05540 [Nitrosopumilus sp.]|nr:hypothetical protein [Nitrosopumilus sp.]